MLNDIIKLIFRVSIGVLVLFHGVHKIIYGIAPIKQMLTSSPLPQVFAYGVYIGEVLMPILIILGLYARVASSILAINMLVAIYLAYFKVLFSLGEHGGVVFELPFVYFLASMMIATYGSGRFAINNK